MTDFQNNILCLLTPTAVGEDENPQETLTPLPPPLFYVKLVIYYKSADKRTKLIIG